MHKQSSKGRKYSKEFNLKYIYFLYERQADMVLFKYFKFSDSKSVVLFFFTFPKNWIGRVIGNETFYWDGLTNINLNQERSIYNRVNIVF